MSYLDDACSLHRLNEPKDIVGFSCGDKDLDDFFTNDCFAYDKQLLGKNKGKRLAKCQKEEG